MKTKIILIAILFIFGLSACNQDKKVKPSEETPKVVLDAFASKFPKAVDPKWEKESETEFEANFGLDGKQYSTKFDMNGKWLETESSIDSSALPKTVKDAIAKDFPGFIPEDIELAETFDKGNVYEMKIEKGEEGYKMAFSSNGDVLKKESVKKEEDEKEEGGKEEDDEKEEKDEKK